MILVNISRSARPGATAAELRASASREWPLRAGATREDLDRQVGQPVLAVARNTIVGTYTLKTVIGLTNGRVEFDLEQTDSPYFGLPVPAGIRYVRGDAWPIKVVETDSAVSLLDRATKNAVAATADSSAVETVRVGGFVVTFDPASPAMLRIVVPRGADVLVRALK